MFLFEGNENVLPILDSDNALPDVTWRQLMDLYVANNGRHNVTEKKFKKFLLEHMNMLIDTMLEDYSFIKESIVEDIKNTR